MKMTSEAFKSFNLSKGNLLLNLLSMYNHYSTLIELQRQTSWGLFCEQIRKPSFNPSTSLQHWTHLCTIIILEYEISQYAVYLWTKSKQELVYAQWRLDYSNNVHVAYWWAVLVFCRINSRMWPNQLIDRLLNRLEWCFAILKLNVQILLLLLHVFVGEFVNLTLALNRIESKSQRDSDWNTPLRLHCYLLIL